MLGFSWNGTLSRTTVGALAIVLLLSYSESRFWMELAFGFSESLERVSQPLVLGAFIFGAFAFGTILTLPKKHDWDDIIAETLCFDKQYLLEIILENRSIYELLIGAARAFAFFAGLGTYNLALRLFRGSGEQSTVGFLIATVFFASVFAWLLNRVSEYPLRSAQRIIALLKEQKTSG